MIGTVIRVGITQSAAEQDHREINMAVLAFTDPIQLISLVDALIPEFL